MIINNDKIPLFKQKSWKFGLMAEDFVTRGNEINMTISVRNPFYTDKNIKYVVSDKFDTQTHAKFILNSAVHSNTEFINVMISNLTLNVHLLPRKIKSV